MDALNPTRRALLGSALLAPIATGAVALPAVMRPSDLPRLIATLKAASAAYCDYSEHVLEPADRLLREQQAAVPHQRVAGTYKNIEGEPRQPSTADAGMIATAKLVIKERPSWAWDEDYKAVCAEIVDLSEARDHEIARLRDQSGVVAMEEESQRRSDAMDAALEAIVDYPAATLAELVLKMDTLRFYGALEGDTLADDIRRLAGEVRA